MARLSFLLIVTALISIPISAMSATFYVSPGNTIQEAIDLAIDGDIIIVRDGTYTGEGNRDIDFRGKAITLKSENGPEVTIIDCEFAGRGFNFYSREERDSIVDGFTITNGSSSPGGGIYCHGGGPTITNCTIVGNFSRNEPGGGICCWHGGDPAVTNCTIHGNYSGGYEGGGGIYCYSSITVANCRIIDNLADSSGGGICCIHGAEITNCLITGNLAGYAGGGIFCDRGFAYAKNCTITGNRAREYGGGMCCYFDGSSYMTGCILWGNEAGDGHEIALILSIRPCELVLRYCDVQGGAGEAYVDTGCSLDLGSTNINADPLLSQDGHLTIGSPCIDCCSNTDLEDIDGETRPFDMLGGRNDYDIGSDEFVDSDVDGLPDWWEEDHFADAQGDQDGDGLINLKEYENGTDPGAPDSDDDGRDDGTEIMDGTNPLHPDNVEKTYYVDGSNGDDSYDGLSPVWAGGTRGPNRTIQSGIDATVTGWGYTVQVADGIYIGTGNKEIEFRGKVITLRGENGAQSTVIDCEYSGRAFSFGGVETREAVLDGFTITNGSAVHGGGIWCSNSSPTIANCHIRGNTAVSGGGMYCNGSDPITRNCVFSGNSALLGGSVLCRFSCPDILNCTLTNNSAATYGGGVYCYASSGPIITGCIMWGNSSPKGHEVAVVSNHESVPVVRYSDVQGGAAEAYVESWYTLDMDETNIDVDPLLTQDRHLRAGSPCIDCSPVGSTHDIDAETRPVDIAGVGHDDPPNANTYDIGSDEYVDTDGDGLPDWWEKEYYADTDSDPDCDGLANIVEYEKGTDAGNPDSDGDGHNDGYEVLHGTNPLHSDNPEKTYYVDCSTGNDEYDGLARCWDGMHGPKETIQAGIDVSISGWDYTVEIADGVYAGNGNRELDFRGRAITLRSENGNGTTTIDCGDSGRGFTFHSYETSSAVLDGLTIMNGYEERYGGGIYCENSSPTITNCMITNCAVRSGASGYGGGICCEDGNPTITDCTVISNEAGYGGGIYCDCSDAVIIDCRVSGNSAHRGGGLYFSESNASMNNCVIAGNAASRYAYGGGICCSNYCHPTIINCTFSSNLAGCGGGISCEGSMPGITSCTISRNFAYEYGGGICCHYSSRPTVTDCILWNNAAPTGHEIAVTSLEHWSTATVRYSDVQGGNAEAYVEARCTLDMDGTNIDEDPVFVKGALHDYYLSQVASGQGVNSPCMDAGSDTAENLGLDGLSTRTDGAGDEGIVDMGYHAPYALWISSINRTSNGMLLHWNALPGVRYVLEFSTDLENWTCIPIGETDSWLDTHSSGYAKRFYRLREQ